MAHSADLLLDLQRRQHEHDLRVHQDVFYLPYPDRIRHLTFHLAKYAGRLAREPVTAAEVSRTIVDAFIVALSAADVLKINCATAMAKWADPGAHRTLIELGRALSVGDNAPGNVPERYFRALADIAGRMAKACESLDHMEPVPYREVLSTALIDLCRATLTAAAPLDLDLMTEIPQRWQEIESHQVL